MLSATLPATAALTRIFVSDPPNVWRLGFPITMALQRKLNRADRESWRHMLAATQRAVTDLRAAHQQPDPDD